MADTQTTLEQPESLRDSIANAIEAAETPSTEEVTSQEAVETPKTRSEEHTSELQSH